MIFARNKYLPLQQQSGFDEKQRRYLLHKINFYLKHLDEQVLETQRLTGEKIWHKRFDEEEKQTELEYLTSLLQDLNKAKQKLILGQELDDKDVSIINELYSKMKLRINIF